jgi:hypothetical protein
MPPRYAYWTILIDNRPTAFRAREREELLPTLQQLRRTNPDATMMWFARGRLWDSPEAERQQVRKPPVTPEKRTRDWRPGGEHKDPRARFDKKARKKAAAQQRPWRDKPRDSDGMAGAPSPPRDRSFTGKSSVDRPWKNRPPAGDRPWQKTRPPSSDRPWQKNRPPSSDRPWQKSRPPSGDRSWQKNRPPAGEHQSQARRPPEGERPWQGKQRAGERPWTDRPKPPGGERPWKDRPWQNKGARPPGGDRPWSNRPPAGKGSFKGERPWRTREERPPGKPDEREPDERREGVPPPKREQSPETPPRPERIGRKPKPPVRG